MFFLKLGLLTCAFYALLIILAEAGIIAFIRTTGGLAYFSKVGTHMYWTLGLQLAVVFGGLWLISFGAAWWIVYKDIEPVLQQALRQGTS